jgi:DNA-binding Lrp family transcriptional regulator
MRNARQSSVEISEKTGLARQTVHKTVRKLEKDHVIWGYRPVVNMRKVGKKLFVTLIKTTSKLTKERVQEVLPALIKIMDEQSDIIFIYTGYVHGYFDWLYIFAADDVIQANKMMRRWKTKYGDLIEDIQIHEELMAIRSSGLLNPDFKQEIDNIL